MGNTIGTIKKGIQDATRAVEQATAQGKATAARGTAQVQERTGRPWSTSRMLRRLCHAERVAVPWRGCSSMRESAQ